MCMVPRWNLSENLCSGVRIMDLWELSNFSFPKPILFRKAILGENMIHVWAVGSGIEKVDEPMFPENKIWTSSPRNIFNWGIAYTTQIDACHWLPPPSPFSYTNPYNFLYCPHRTSFLTKPYTALLFQFSVSVLTSQLSASHPEPLTPLFHLTANFMKSHDKTSMSWRRPLHRNAV